MGTQYTVKTKKDWFLNRFNIAKIEGEDLDKEKLIANFCLDNNSTRNKALELLKQFVTLEYISIEKNKIIIKWLL